MATIYIAKITGKCNKRSFQKIKINKMMVPTITVKANPLMLGEKEISLEDSFGIILTSISITFRNREDEVELLLLL
jgi:hypothetical protein